jgi:hypothetical protein
MGFGIDLLAATGKWVASWPWAVSIVPSISGTSLFLMTLGGLWLCLWQTRWRALGLVIAAAGLLVSGTGTRPDVLVERDGRSVALRTDDGALACRLRRVRAIASTIACSPRPMTAMPRLRPRMGRSAAIAWLHRQGEGQDHRADPSSRGAGRGLPYRRHRHCPVQRRQRLPGGTDGGRPARTASRWGLCALYRGAVDPERERRRDARAKTLGA